MNIKHSKPITDTVRSYIELYNSGLSIYQIGKKLNKKPNSVLKSLKYWKVPMRCLGKDTENKVKKFLIRKGKQVIQKTGDCAYDLLVDEVRVDVKEAHLTRGRNQAYIFELIHEKNRNKDYRTSIDEFYLVLLDEQNIPMYSLKTSEVNVKRALSIPKSLQTKYPVKFIGYLHDMNYKD